MSQQDARQNRTTTDREIIFLVTSALFSFRQCRAKLCYGLFPSQRSLKRPNMDGSTPKKLQTSRSVSDLILLVFVFCHSIRVITFYLLEDSMVKLYWLPTSFLLHLYLRYAVHCCCFCINLVLLVVLSRFY